MRKCDGNSGGRHSLLRRRLRRITNNPMSMLGLGIISFWVLIAVLAPLIAPYNPMQIDLQIRFEPPSLSHLFGTDFYGRDVLTRVMYGARYDLVIAVLAVVFAAGVGTPFGLIAGYFGGLWDEIIMRVADLILSFPTLVFAMVLAAILGPGLEKTIGVLSFIGTAGYARLARGSTLSAREETYIEAARAVGVSTSRILFHHILPNILSPIVTRATLGMGFTVLSAASLSFIGLGVCPPAPEWGAIINEGRTSLVLGKWWITTFSGLAIMTLVLGFNLLGDGLRDVLDPREMRGKRS